MPYRLLRRLVSPAGVLLALLCFGLPFVAVSCGTTTVEYTGLDLVAGGTATVTVGSGATPGGSDTGAVHSERSRSESTPIPPQPLAGLTLLAIVAGLVIVALPRVAALTRAVVASVTALLLMLNEVVAYERIVYELRTSADLRVPAEKAEDMVRMRAGFWLALALLLGVAAYNVIEVMLDHRPVAGRLRIHRRSR